MSDYKYAYEKLMDEESITSKELPEKAEIGIKMLKDIEKTVLMNEKKGKTISESVVKKIEAIDSWICDSIIESLNSNSGEESDDDDDDEIPYTSKEIVDEINSSEEEEGQQPQKSELGFQIDKELKSMHESGKSKWTSNEIKSGGYKATYDTIMDTYEDGEENGIETTNYSLIEEETEVFTINKK